LTENVDATNYTFGQSQDQGGGDAGGGQQSGGGAGGTGGNSTGNFQYAEVETGCIWTIGTVSPSTAIGVAPTMQPPVHSMRINVDTGLGDGVSYNYCRPSSKHPTGINIAFVGQQVQFMKDSISYFVYCKLMSSDDGKMRIPGTQTLVDNSLRSYQLNDADVNP
jgi:hypothetical protein